MLNINWAFIRRRWWKLLVLGVLIAVVFAAAPIIWPQIECSVFGQGCSEPRDLACDSAGGNCCNDYGGERTAWDCGKYLPDGSMPGFYFCGSAEYHDVGTKCAFPNSCWVSSFQHYRTGQWISAGPRGEIEILGCTVADANGDGDCDSYPVVTHASCCSGGGGGGGGGGGDDPPCEPEYAPPTIGTGAYTLVPPYPIVITQDDLKLGFTLGNVTLTGGADTNCGEAPANITSLTAEIHLTDEAQDWIAEDLAQRYYGARVRGAYPAAPTDPISVSGLGSPNAVLNSLHYHPVDPGQHIVRLRVTQSDGQTAARDIYIRVWLLDTTILPGD
ncbi:MAG TPA: hypothetical protein PLA25_01700 [Anaerolineaceae bacterium]|nr:hypothetical protein [Anaerolineaceae bacterium]